MARPKIPSRISKVRQCFTLDPDKLDKLTELSLERGVSRSEILNDVIHKIIEEDMDYQPRKTASRV